MRGLFSVRWRVSEFGNISVMTKWIKAIDTCLLLRNLEVNYKEVRILKLDCYCLFPIFSLFKGPAKMKKLYGVCVSYGGSSASVRLAYSVFRMA